jgi:PAS domain S-box-containing protein
MSTPAKKITASSLATDTFEQSEQLFRVLCEKSSEAIALLDRNGIVLYASPSTTRVLGYTSEEFVGRSALQLIHPDDLEQTTYALTAVVEEPGKSLTLEYRLRHRDSSWRWIEGTGTNFLADPSVRAIVLTYRDITERKCREEERQQRTLAIQKQQRTFDALLNASPDHIFMLDTQGRFIYVNQAALEVIQAASTFAKKHPEGILGKTGKELGFPPAFLRQFEGQIAKARSGKTVAAETPFPTPHGIRMFEYILSPIHGGDGSVEALAGITRDIHERNQAAEERSHLLEQVRAERALLQAVLQQMPSGVIIAEAPTGKIIHGNKQVESIWRYPLVQAAQVSQYDQFTGFHPDGRLYQPEELPLARSILQGEVVNAEEISFLRGDGTLGTMSVNSAPIRDQRGTIVAGVVIFNDMTKRKKTEEALREQEVKLHVKELKDQLLLHLSHEFRTPLTAVSGYLELLKAHHERLDTSQLASFLDKALASCNELTLLLDSIMEAMQITNEMKPAQPEKLVVAHVVREVVDQLDFPQEQGQALQLDISEQVTVWADKHYLRQIVRNLLSNAFKYAPKRTSVIINAAVSKGARRETDVPAQVCISVKDAGPGIPPAELPLLFEKFVRLKRDLTGTVRGTGLGLFISKQLAEAMGGYMWVESTGSEGEGSRFCFTLPVAAGAFHNA